MNIIKRINYQTRYYNEKKKCKKLENKVEVLTDDNDFLLKCLSISRYEDVDVIRKNMKQRNWKKINQSYKQFLIDRENKLQEIEVIFKNKGVDIDDYIESNINVKK